MVCGWERASPWPVPGLASTLTRGSSRYADDEGARHASTFKVGMMLDEQLNQEMHNAMRSHQSSDDDKYNSVAGNKVSTSAAVLDLAHISQTSPRPLFATRDSPEVSSSPDLDGPQLMMRF
ncbi:hypothetical protein C8R45DRAFT_211905 [Mycena sanguinolenta]|nr:hypothetical protein C8R45DRAFT_211905 [Mycena sanguinolenta]